MSERQFVIVYDFKCARAFQTRLISTQIDACHKELRVANIQTVYNIIVSEMNDVL